MEPVGEEEAQLVLLSPKSFVSLFYTESDLENDSASFEEKTEGGFAWQVYEPGLWQEGRNGGKVTRGEESFNTLKLPVKD